jgi:NAD(P)-dependent dehydrogenase (short-subunit alcohol dehydrogenase family)
MDYFVTGATGFIGRHLLERLLARGGTVYALVRGRSRARLDAVRARYAEAGSRVIAVGGDLAEPGLGVDDATVGELRGKIDHFFHVAGLYDMTADAERLAAINVAGTRQAVELAHALGARRFHHVSSIAAAGRYAGRFREDMFEEAVGLEDPYFRTKHDSEAVVRTECRIPWRIYRPGIVVGHTLNGEIDKVDGPYYVLPLLKRLRGVVPRWFPLFGIEGSRINIVPVDFVAGALDVIAHQGGLDGRAFHLVDANPKTVGEAMNVFARAAKAPEFVAQLDARLRGSLPAPLLGVLGAVLPVRQILERVVEEFGIPPRVLAYVDQPTTFDCRETERALRGSAVAAPDLESYASRLWEFWERRLDPDLYARSSLAAAVRGRRVLITGASSGIGKAAALRLGAAGAVVLLVARSQDKLEELAAEIRQGGGTAHCHPADLADLASCDRLVASVLERHGGVDVLINNAGRSIRRSIALSYDRFHDFHRTMQLNYFGAIKLILGFLPGMRERKDGQVVNISSVGVQANPPRFSAYVASKSALDAFSRCAGSELLDDNVGITTVYMPLVRTEMIAPTKIYRAFPTISPDDAAEMICEAIRARPKRVSTWLGVFGEVSYALVPRTVDLVLATAYRLFPDSAAARGEPARGGEEVASAQQIAFARLIPGVHW